jgi:hypothetical protein
MRSQPGDYVGQRLDYDFAASNAASTFGGGPYGINAWVTSGSEWWGVDMTPAAGQILAPGYTGSGIDVFGDGRSCAAITGSFTVTHAVFSPVDNSLQHFAASVTQRCAGSSAALTGTRIAHGGNRGLSRHRHQHRGNRTGRRGNLHSHRFRNRPARQR